MSHSAPYPIRLRRDGNYAVVEIDTGVPNYDGNSFVEIIRERADCAFCHIVEPNGIERAMDRHYNQRP